MFLPSLRKGCARSSRSNLSYHAAPAESLAHSCLALSNALASICDIFKSGASVSMKSFTAISTNAIYTNALNRIETARISTLFERDVVRCTSARVQSIQHPPANPPFSRDLHEPVCNVNVTGNREAASSASRDALRRNQRGSTG